MSLTVQGRDSEALSCASRYLGELREAVQHTAGTNDPRWFSPYALGFMTGHVALGMQFAASRYLLKWFSRWPDADEHVKPWIKKLAPQCLGLDAANFDEAYDKAATGWVGGGGNTPVNIGGGMGNYSARMLERMNTAIPRDYFGVRIMELETELRKLRAPTRLGRLTGYRSARLVYRYLVRRTLGAEVFGMTKENAERMALAGA